MKLSNDLYKILPDGKILVAGYFLDTGKVWRIYRLNANGTIDRSFNEGNTSANNTVTSINVLPDNKILIGGFFTTYNGIARNGIARINADGSLDTSFDSNVGTNGHYVS